MERLKLECRPVVAVEKALAIRKIPVYISSLKVGLWPTFLLFGHAHTGVPPGSWG
jgi:hypothetical protein